MPRDKLNVIKIIIKKPYLLHTTFLLKILHLDKHNDLNNAIWPPVIIHVRIYWHNTQIHTMTRTFNHIFTNTKVHTSYLLLTSNTQSNMLTLIKIYWFMYKIQKNHKRHKSLYLFIVISPPVYVHFAKANNPKEVHPHIRIYSISNKLESW